VFLLLLLLLLLLLPSLEAGENEEETSPA
jgi:hypothetical protein